MDYRVHTVGAIVAACGVGYLENKIGLQGNSLYLYSGAVVGGLLPDIDHPKSFTGRMILPLSDIIKEAVGHRTLTHSLLFAFIAGLIFSVYNIGFGAGVCIGILSHIILDLLTPKTTGVAFLYPFHKEYIKLL